MGELRASVEVVFERFPTLAENLGPELGTTSILQQMNVHKGDMTNRAVWGWHDMESWQTFFDTIAGIAQVERTCQAGDVPTPDLVGPVYDVDKEKERADAEAYELSEAMQAVDVETIGSNLFASGI